MKIKALFIIGLIGLISLPLLFSEETFADDKPVVQFAASIWEPFMIPNGEVQKGIDFEIALKLAEELGMEILPRECPFKRCLLEMAKGRLDLQSGIAFNEERAAYMVYLQPPYSEVSARFYTRKGESDILKTYDDLNHLRVGLVSKSHYFEPFNSDDGLQKYEVPKEEMLFPLLEKGRIDVIIGTSPNLEYQIKKYGHKGKFEPAAYDPNKVIPLYFAISKKSPLLHFAEDLGDVLQRFEHDGVMAEIEKNYR
jgi:polar amino acid transport system substrate-binding protein